MKENERSQIGFSIYKIPPSPLSQMTTRQPPEPAKNQPSPKKRRKSIPSEQLTTLPLMLPKSASENTVLVQLDDRENATSTGDAGAIGRLRVKDGRIELDLNGKRLLGKMYPSVTCMVVSIGKTEAKVMHVVDEVCVVSSSKDMLNKMGGVVVGGVEEDVKEVVVKKSKMKTARKSKSPGGKTGSSSSASSSSSNKNNDVVDLS